MNLHPRLACVALGAAVFLAALPPPAGARALRVVRAADYRRIVRVGDPAIAPDGRHVALVVTRVRWNADRRRRELISIDVATKAVKVLARGGDVSSPAYAPDGTQLAFLATRPHGRHDQVMVIPAGGGAIRAVTRAPAGVDAFAWRPDGRAFAYAAVDPRPHRTGAARFRNSFVFTTEPIVAHSKPRPDHLFVVGSGGGAATQLTFGPASALDFSWSPDGKRIALTLAPDAIANDSAYSHVALLDVASKRLRALTGRSMWEFDPTFSPDGRKIAYLYSDGDPQIAPTELYVTTPHGGPGTVLAPALDRPVGDAVWSHGGRSLIVTAPSGLTNALYRIALTGRVQRLGVGNVTPGIPLVTTGGAATPPLRGALANDGALAFSGSWTNRAPEAYVRLPDGTTRQLTSVNAALDRIAWGSATRIRFATTTGTRGDGVLYRPPGFVAGRRYPLVLYVHGGPGDPTQLSFDFWAQLMAARGWLVLRPNYRGSPNLGSVYQRAIFDDPDAGPGDDLMSALHVVEAQGIVDPARIAVCGWSYGGIMAAWMISKYHIWNSAVVGASVNDWIADYGTADDSLADRDLFPGSPFVGDNAAQWRAASAITYAADVTTPVLILSDVGDNRDPFATSSMYWRALRDNGKDATLRVWPIAGHFPDDPVRTADVYHYWIAYLAAHFTLGALRATGHVRAPAHGLP